MAQYRLDARYPDPRSMLEKARRDAQRLDDATFAEELQSAADAFLDAASAVYHLKDWIGAKHPPLKGAATQYIDTSEALLLCRDVCIAQKHVGYRLDQGPYKTVPPRLEELDHTAVASAGTFAGLPSLKLFVEGGNHRYADEVLREAIRAWEAFFDRHDI